ncbi:MAG: amidohydrolase family protein [Bacteroidia bacterium]|nr:amidohydrolase family protein [Bacteroidia bacterium]MDW8235502.1 hypothetical protein [Bacteroidia bacterium]
MAPVSHVRAHAIVPPSGDFRPDWLYYKGRLWYRPAVRLHEGQVVYFSPEPHPQAMPIAGLLSPAWINAHTHLELSHLSHQIPQGRGMIDFIQRMGPRRGNAAASVIYSALQEACIEGTCAFVSHQNHPLLEEAIPAYAVVQPLREFYGLRRRGARQQYRKLSRQPTAFTPHSLYALARPLLRKAARPTQFPRSLHFMESIEERLWLTEKKGPFRTFLQQFDKKPPRLRWLYWIARLYRKAPALWLVHSAELSPLWIEKLLHRFQRLYFVLCPVSNYYLFRRMPPLSLWEKYPHRFLVGTDSLASSFSLSLWKSVQSLYAAGLSWATILRAVVDTPRQWIRPKGLWVQVAPLSPEGHILPYTKARLFCSETNPIDKR